MKMENSNNKPKEKLSRFLDYYKSLFNLKRKVIKKVEDYEEVIWLYEIPNEKECFCILNASGVVDETILEVYLPDEPKKPIIPQEISNYVVFDKNEEPKLNETLLQQSLQQNKTTQKELHQIREIFENYEKKYIEWLIENERWGKIYKVYEKLYKMYFELRRNEAVYELIVGCGLLLWRQPNGQIIQRHILTAKCTLEFEKDKKEIKVLFDENVPIINLEYGMIDLDYLPAGIIESKKKLLEDSSVYDLFSMTETSSNNITTFLKIFVNTLHPQGKYNHTIQPDLKNINEIPRIEFAPAIILRKRIEPYLKWLNDLSNLKINEISPLILEIAEIKKEDEEFYNKNKSSLKDYQFYFPKPYNEEQKKIVEKLNFSNLVVIQGPPGTGKSHTIANLVAHLLAEGKRVLITAKTARALTVLKKLIPEKLRQLCIFLFGDSGLEEKEHLEHSVKLLLYNLQNLDSEKLENSIKELEEELQKIKCDKIELTHQILRLINLEKEDYKEIGIYKGSRADLALQFEQDKEKFAWFEDHIHYDKNWPDELNSVNWDKFITNLNFFKSYNGKEFAGKQLENLIKDLKQVFNLLPLDEIENLIAKEIKIVEQLKRFEGFAIKFVDKNMSNLLKLDFLNESITFFQNFKEKLDEIGVTLPHIKDLCVSILQNEELMKNKINKIKSIKEEVLNLLCVVPKEINDFSRYETIINDIEILLHYLQSGGKLGFWIFRPNLVKEREYLIKNCYVNGKKCNTIEDLKKLQIYLKTLNELEKLYSEWAKYFGDISVTTSKEKYKILKEKILNPAEQILKHEELFLKCRLYQKHIGITDPSIFFDSDKIVQLIDELNYFKLQAELVDIQQKINQLIKELKKINASCFNLKNLINYLEEKKIDELFKIINKIKEEKNKVLIIEKNLDILKKHLPNLIDKIYFTPDYEYWTTKIKDLKRAWDWARLKFFLQEITSENDFEQLNKRLSQLQDEERKIIEDLVALKAWYFLSQKIDRETKKHLVAWEQAIKKIGRGKGKYVNKYMKDAQSHLEKIIYSFPTWIMPIYKIYYTFEIKNFPWFDVMIVDEASQCSILEGFPLFQLATKVVIVGDDKQISPEAIGIEKSNIFQLQKEYLYDFDFIDTFDLESSIFDLGKRISPDDIITLKEHFRCMPEIIEFCNRYFYNGFLVPLKVFSLDRLNPLEKKYVSNAYCKGSGNNVINPIEAEAIVEKIVEICSDERYKNKTIGVISLLGEEQAKYIESLLIKKLNHKEILERQLLCGNPYSFQGDERDIIFLSLVIAPINEDGTKRHIGVLNRVQDERRFNVAVSRAKEQIWLFHSVKIEDLSPQDLRKKLLEYFYTPQKFEIGGIEFNELRKIAISANRNFEKPPSPFESWFEFDVALEILKLGFEVKPQFKVGPYRIDLVIFDKLNTLNRLAIECDGDKYHGIEHIERDINRQKILERCGWKFFRIRASEFYFDKTKVLEKLKSTLESLNIYPG
jgi:very-short-patch-repair endonuclease/energy-coupling factor transporter ATP-binding protein EcfA2